MISIIDYGLGNLRAFTNIYKRLNVPIELVTTEKQLSKAQKIILPGVGAFDHAMESLGKSGLMPLLNELVVEKRTPVLGICVGMQMLAKSSDEGQLPGLGWIDGKVEIFDINKIKHTTRLPHMGWNDVQSTKKNILFDTMQDTSLFYFLHSYFFVCNDHEDSIAESEYGSRFTCAVNRDNIYGVQFHPEKSHGKGIQLLKNFALL